MAPAAPGFSDGFWAIAGGTASVTGGTFGDFHAPEMRTAFDYRDRRLQASLTLLSAVTASPLPYGRVVRDAGNERSRTVLAGVFTTADAEWRGLGAMPQSGLELRSPYAGLDARKRFAIEVEKPADRRACRCGDVLRGLIDPPACPLFNKACRPDQPLGPCMVSSEGPCSAYYKYGGM